MGADPSLSRCAPQRCLVPEFFLLFPLWPALPVLCDLPLRWKLQRHREFVRTPSSSRGTTGRLGNRKRPDFLTLQENIMLPIKKTPPKTNLSDLTVLIYGQSKFGKSTW